MLDLMICLSIVIGAVIGIRKGFVRGAYEMISSILALVLAFFLYTPVKTILSLTPLYTTIQRWNMEKVSSFPVVQGVQSQAQAIKEATQWLPDFVSETIVKNNNSEIYDLVGATNLVEYISNYITDLCLTVLAIIVVWCVVKILLGIGVSAIDLIAKLPLIKTANKILGGTLGAMKTVLTIWVIGLIVPVLVVIPELTALQTAISESIVTKWLYENNGILYYMNLFLFK